jgi:hypothetical protein
VLGLGTASLFLFCHCTWEKREETEEGIIDSREDKAQGKARRKQEMEGERGGGGGGNDQTKEHKT